MCERWRNSFEAFLADMGPRPEGHSIDRIDPNGNYEPGNCRWAERLTQERNRTSNHRLTFNGETLALSEWSERTGINYRTLQDRLVNGWSVEKALTTPCR
jgi:hypothetical protein